MPIPKHVRITFRGIFNGTPEAWSHGLHLRAEGALIGDPDDVHAEDVDLEALVTAWTTMGQSAVQVPSNAKLMDVRAYTIGTDGRTVGNPRILDVSTRGITGGSTNRYPPQVAMAITLVSENRGPAKFGRYYLPAGKLIDFGDSRIAIADATNIALASSAFLKAVSDATDMPNSIRSAAVVNVSARGGPDGTAQNVHHVEVGRVLDTLRTRRKSMLEDRVADAAIDW